MPEIFTLITFLAYLLAFILLLAGLKTGRRKLMQGSMLVWAIAIISHAILLSSTLLQGNGLNLSFYNAISDVTWLVSVLLFFTSLTRPVHSLGLVILPVAAFAVILTMIFPGLSSHISQGPFGLKLHILFSLLAYAFLTLAATQALLLSYQDRKLRHHNPVGLIQKLPPLQHMESLLFQLIGLGFILLSIALISGFIFLEDMFAQRIVHKTVLSVVSWLVFAALLWGRWKLGWRGRKAIRWTLWGFIFLALAYFGSKLVRELILHSA